MKNGDKMKILMITPDFVPGFGGIGIHVKNLLDIIAKKPDCYVTLLICRMRRTNDVNREYEEFPKINIIQNKNIRILDLNAGIQTKVDKYYKKKPIFTEEAYHDFRTINNCSDVETRILENIDMLDTDYDLIHLHDAFNGPLAVLLKKMYNCPLLTTIHGINAEEFTMIDNLKRYTIFNSDYLITVNSELKQLIGQRYIVQKPTEVIYNSINMPNVSDIHLNIENTFLPPYYITFCGRIDMYKGLDILLEALKILIENGEKVKLIIIGDGLQKKKCRIWHKIWEYIKIQFGQVPELIKMLWNIIRKHIV